MPTPKRTSPLLKASDIEALFEKLSRALLRYLDASNEDDPERFVARRVALAKVEVAVAAGLLNHVARDFRRLEGIGKKARLTKKQKRELDRAIAKLEPFFR